MWKALACELKAHATGLKPAMRAPEEAIRHLSDREDYPLLRELHAQITTKATVDPAQTTVAGWAAELMQVVNAQFVSALAPLSLFGQLFAEGQAISLDLSKPLKVPGRSGVTLGGGFYGEGAPIRVAKTTMTSTPLNPCKFAVISTFTEELSLYSDPAIEAVLRQIISEDSAAALDLILTDNAAGSAIRPPGLLNGVTPLTASTAPATVDAAALDAKALIAAIAPATRIAFACNPAQAPALARALEGTSYTIMISAAITAGTVLAIDLDSLVGGANGVPRFSLSSQTVLHEVDANPQAIGTAGSPATVAAPARSMFQTDAIAIKMIWFMSWALRRAGAVAVVTATSW